jgi:predicted lysophospholipase L1 biosynthesis ABC-type transport system permease subunit
MCRSRVTAFVTVRAPFAINRVIAARRTPPTGYIRTMDPRSYADDAPQFDAAVRLATWLSLIAVVVAVAARLAAVPEQPVVLSVIVIGFVASWVLTGRRTHPVGTRPRPVGVPVR